MANRGKTNKGQEAKTEVERPIRLKKYQYLYLIVCEDENTEPRYFESFSLRIPENTIYLRPVGTGRDPKGVVERAIVERNTLAVEAKRTVDVVWVVFDKDDADQNATKVQRFNDAFSIAGEQTFKLAYSNEVFELWLLLHLMDVDPNTPLPRQTVYQQLQAQIRLVEKYATFEYDHGNENVLSIIAEIGDEQAALRRADILINENDAKGYLKSNPVTYVNRLILDLYSWINYYSYQG